MCNGCVIDRDCRGLPRRHRRESAGAALRVVCVAFVSALCFRRCPCHCSQLPRPCLGLPMLLGPLQHSATFCPTPTIATLLPLVCASRRDNLRCHDAACTATVLDRQVWLSVRRKACMYMCSRMRFSRKRMTAHEDGVRIVWAARHTGAIGKAWTRNNGRNT